MADENAKNDTSEDPKPDHNTIVGTVLDDTISTAADDITKAAQDDLKQTLIDRINGNAGSDTITSGLGNDLAAGDMVGSEWSLVNGRWVYDPSQLAQNTTGYNPSYDDTIDTGEGDDVLLGNGGDDLLRSGAGNDTINAGTGQDVALGGAGDDLINLEAGHDTAEGGIGDDVVNAGSGNDTVYGDNKNENLLDQSGGPSLTSFSQYEASGVWEVSEEDGISTMSQSVETSADETYTINFELAANLAGGATAGTVEVLWNGKVVGEVTTTSGVYETHSIDVPGCGKGDLTFREVEIAAKTAPDINMDGPIFSYDKDVAIGGQDVSVAAFAPGQAKLYQVIDGQLKVFDTAEKEYVDAGEPTGIKLNAIGFNVEDDLIYGVAKQAGTDALGNEVSVKDLMMIDANGNAYRVGEAPYADYVGDFDDQGNLWTFNSSLNRVSKIDVDQIGDGDGAGVTNYDLPDNLFGGRTYDLAYNAKEGVFMAVESPGKNGGDGAVHRIDMSKIDAGGVPEITSIPITGTLIGDDMSAGMAKGAYGAVFLDGDGNLYYGLNRGDHDLDASTGAQGSIFKVNMDWNAGTAYSKFLAEAQSTGSNDGAVDPRSADAFTVVDLEAPFLIRNPEVLSNSGGNDDLRGGEGDDLMYGGGGGDTLHGGTGDDSLSGDAGNDRVYGDDGDDVMSGGAGDDRMTGGTGNDALSGDAGKDYINAGTGDDTLSGGDGNDKLVGGSGSDTIDGGAGDDHMWGGNWWKDGASDTFVITAGGGKDMIHDFEADHDQIDLSAYGLEFSDLQNLMADKGWATEIDLSGLDGGSAGDKLLIKSVDPDDLDESNFLL